MRRTSLTHRSGLPACLAQLALFMHLRVARDLPRHLHTRKSAQPLTLKRWDVGESLTFCVLPMSLSAIDACVSGRSDRPPIATPPVNEASR